MTTGPIARRWLQPTSHSDLQVTWHDDEDGHAVISLWRNDRCVASAPLNIAEAASLTSFLVAHLGERAAEATPEVSLRAVPPS